VVIYDQRLMATLLKGCVEDKAVALGAVLEEERRELRSNRRSACPPTACTGQWCFYIGCGRLRLLFAICYLLFAICYLLFAICYLPFAICHLPFSIGQIGKLANWQIAWESATEVVVYVK
jgi:hypothetical protein